LARRLIGDNSRPRLLQAAQWDSFNPRVFRADGVPPLQGKGILFPSLATVLKDFAKFAELLSVSGIVNRLHLAHLIDAEGIAVPSAEQHFYVLDPTEARSSSWTWRCRS
jgi:hypothetical protein